MFTLRLNLSLILLLALIAACAAPQNINVQGAQIQNSAAQIASQQSPNAQATATPSASTTVSTTALFPSNISNAPLEVVSTSPTQDADEIAVSRDATKIIVQFNHPVVPLVSVEAQKSLPQPLTISPALTGSGLWINTSTYSFTPSQNLQVATEYTVNVAPLTDMLGASLSGYTWKFKTASPEIVLAYPEANTQNAGASQPISMTFNTEMDRASVEARFGVVASQTGAPVVGKFEWNGAQLKFLPDAPLAYNTLYRATLKAGALDINKQAATKKDVTWNFRTSRAPGVLATIPKNGDTSSKAIRNGFQITYASPMAQDAVTVTIHPTITNQYSYWENDTKQTISGGWLASETYSVTISGQSETVYGETLGKDTVVVFTAAPLDPEVYLNVTGTAGMYDANQPQIIYTTYRNVDKIEYALYTVPRADLLRIVGKDRYEYWDNYKPSMNNLLRQWSQAVSAPLNASRVISTSLGGNTPSTYLKPGAYLIVADGVDPKLQNPRASRHILIVTPYNLALKRNETDALVWATTLATGKPVADLPITIFTSDGKAAATGKTDKDGIYRGTFPRQDYWEPIFAVSEENTDLLAAVGSDWNEGIQTFDFNLQTQYGAQEYYANLYTDRAIYRPGQTVYFKGILRKDHDARYTLPTELKTVPIKVMDSNGREILNQSLPLNAYGTFNGEIKLNDGASLGYYTIVLEFGPENRRFYSSTDFQVAQYKKPEYEVLVTTDKDSYINGETIKVNVDSTYYFGGPVADAKVQWRLLSDDLFFTTDKVKGYWDFTDFELTNERQRTGGVIREGKGTTDKQGKFSFSVPAELKDYPLSQNFTIDVEITDINNAAVSNRVVVPVHKGDYYIGLRPQSYVGQVNAKQGVDIITVTPQGEPSPNRALTISVYEHKWFSVREKDSSGNFYWKSAFTDTLVTEIGVTTNVSGTATAYFTPTVGGVYKIVGQGKDDKGNSIRSATYQWIATNEFVNWRIENNDRIDLVADKKEYRVGETAKVLVPAPFKNAQALLTIERGGILQVKPLGVIGNSETLEIPITQELLPTAYVSVMLVKGREADSPTPQFKLGYATLNVNPAEKILNVRVTTEGKDEFQPRDNVKFTIEATDASGKPAATEFSVALVDKAVQALADDRSTPLEKAFWGTRGIGVQTSASWVRSVERINLNVQAEAKGGGGGAPEETSPVRRNFQDTAYWKADVVTDSSGRATVTIPLPDNLTTWNFTAKGVTQETLVGTGKLDVISTKPVLVRPVVPRFFVPGDQVLLEAAVNNNTDQNVTVDVKLQATGLTLQGNATQPLTVKAKDKAKVSWQTTVNQDASAVRVEFSASGGPSTSSGERYNDALEATLPVVRPTSPEVVGTAGTVDAQVLEKIQVPANADKSVGGLEITTSPSLAAASLESMDFLKAYPYECSEQVVSKFYPNVVTFQALKEFGITSEELQNNLSVNISAQIQQLYQLQHGDGGWGLWTDDQSMPHTTAYAVLALDAAKRAGFSVDENVIQRGKDYLNQYLDTPTNANQASPFNERAFVLYALSETSEESYGSRALNLYERRAQLDNFAKSYLMMTLAKTGNKPQAQALAQELTAAAIPSASGTHWEEKHPDWYMMNTDTRTTAIVLYGLARVDPQNALLKNAVRWLMTMRQQGHWSTTQETAWSLLGLTEFMKESGELSADYAYDVSVNNKSLGQEQVTKDNVAENKTFTVAMKDLLTDTANELLITRTAGPGNLYYNAFLRYDLPADQIQALNRGVSLARQYFAVEQATLKPTVQPITSANVGDYVQVKLTIIAPTNLHYLLVEDPLPSGFEAVDTSLKTTSAGATAPELDANKVREQISDCTACAEYYHPYWYYWANTELRDDKVALFANDLSKGTYEYKYLMRASVSGEFTVLPTTAQQMYEPDVFGRSNGTSFVVTPQ